MSNERRLLDFNWIAGELERAGIYELLKQYDDPPEELPQDGVEVVQDALRLSAHVLEHDQQQLPGQLLGRIVYWDSDAWGDLPNQILAWDEYPWLQPLQASLAPAGGALQLTINAHQEYIVDALISADQAQVITAGSGDPVIRIWNLTDGRPLRELSASGAGVTGLVMLSDGVSLLAGDSAGAIRRWNTVSGEIGFENMQNKDPIIRMAVDIDESVLCASTENGKLLILDLRSGEVLHQVAGHKTAVRYLYMLDGAGQVVTLGDDRHVKVWSIESGEEVHDWYALKERPTAVLLSSDGRTLVAGDLNGTLICWDLVAGEQKTEFKGHGAKINQMLWLNKEKQFVSASADKLVSVWDLSITDPAKTLSGHKAEVWSIALSADQKRLASGAKEDQVIVWNIDEEEAVYVLSGHDRGAGPLQFLNGDQLLLTADFDGLFRVWSMESGERLRLLRGHERAVMALYADDEGDELISTAMDGTIRLWRSSKSIEPMPVHDGDPRYMQPLLEKGLLATAALAEPIFIWNSEDGSLRHQLCGHTENLTLLKFGTKKRPLISASLDGTAKAWEPIAGDLLLDMAGHKAGIRDLVVTSDGELITAASDTLIHIWDLEDGNLLDTLKGHKGGLLNVALVGDGEKLLSFANDGQLKLWDLGKRSLIADLEPAIRYSNGFQLDKTKRVVAGINTAGQPQLWHLESLGEGTVLEGHSGAVSKFQLSGDGTTLVSAAGAKDIIVWDAARAQPVHKLSGHEASIDALLLNTLMGRVVTAAHDGSIKLWDTGSGQLVADLVGHTSWITHLLPADSIDRVLSAEGAGIVKLWDVSEGKELASFVGHNGNIKRIVPRPDTNVLVTTGSDKSVRVWTLDSGEELAQFQLEQRPVNIMFSGVESDITVSDAGGAVHFLRMRDVEAESLNEGDDSYA